MDGGLDQSKAKRSKVVSDKQSEQDIQHDNWNKNASKLGRRNELPHPSAWLNTDGSFMRNPYGQTSFFHKAMSICFVCGNATGEENTLNLYSRSPRSQPDAPFFPFLEYHDPAPGAESMKDDWSVVACFVCNALLSQQWESFEKARMPIGKRLYWLKRPSGCEIRQPVSQIELEEILNEHSRDNFDERDDYESEEEQSDAPPHPPALKRPHSPDTKHPEEKRRSPSSSKQATNDALSAMKSSPLVCYSCGKTDTTQCSICPVHCKPSYEQMRAGVPFYPSVLSRAGAPDATVLCDSITFMCLACLPKHKPEWHLAQQDFIKQDATKSVLPRIPLPEVVLCYLCGNNVSTKFNDGLVHTAGKGNSCFKKLSSCKPILGSVPLTFGFTYLCAGCHSGFLQSRVSSKRSSDDELENDTAKK